MAQMLLSNPGLPLAVLGNPPTRRNKRRKASAAKRRRKVSKRKRKAVNPQGNPMAKKRRRYSKKRKNPSRRRRSYRRNPVADMSVKGYVRGLTTSPQKIMSLFRGKNKVRNVVYAGGGAVGSYLLSGLLTRKVVGPILGRTGLAPDGMLSKSIGVLMPYTTGYLASKVVKDKQLKSAMLVGGAAASVIELLMPGKVGELIERIPGLGPKVAEMAPEGTSPQQGMLAGMGQTMLAGYVSDASYRGTGAYVDAPGYAGTAGNEGLAAYVDAPSYAGTAGVGQEMLAGSFLEESNMFQPYL